MDEHYIYRYLAGEATDEEKQELQRWLEDSAQNRYFFFEIRAIWHAQKIATGQNEEKLQRSIQELNERIDDVLASENRKRKNRTFRIIGGAVSAAILLLIIGLRLMDSGINSTEQHVYEDGLVSVTNTSIDSVKPVTLPDGSLVWLAENATLVYPSDFTTIERQVYLDGEAYFEVEKDQETPFIVKTDVNQIRVLGTSFSVNSDYEGHSNEVILTSGSVQLQRLDGIGLINLNPGQKALYSKETNMLEINEVDLQQYSSWRYGLITLTNVPIESILKCLQDTYKVSVSMDIRELQNRRYYFSFKRSKGVQDALEQLSFMTGIPASLGE